jgi:hypothetical protein
MSTPDTKRLAEIQARADKATKGPWAVNGLTVIASGDGELEHLADYETLGDTEEDFDQMLADADFSASAREDVPWLLAEVARLTVELCETTTLAVELSDRIALLEAGQA